VHFPEPVLIAMVGAAGSGKSTAAKAFPASWRLELDALRAIAAGNFSVKFSVLRSRMKPTPTRVFQCPL
jgi:predicted kinase